MKWELLHVYLYKKLNGKIPTGKIIVFNDNDNANFDKSNLIAITRAEHLERTRLRDTTIATRMAQGDMAKRKELLENHPTLIALKRTSLILNKTINETNREKR